MEMKPSLRESAEAMNLRGCQELLAITRDRVRSDLLKVDELRCNLRTVTYSCGSCNDEMWCSTHHLQTQILERLARDNSDAGHRALSQADSALTRALRAMPSAGIIAAQERLKDMRGVVREIRRLANNDIQAWGVNGPTFFNSDLSEIDEALAGIRTKLNLWLQSRRLISGVTSDDRTYELKGCEVPEVPKAHEIFGSDFVEQLASSDEMGMDVCGC